MHPGLRNWRTSTNKLREEGSVSFREYFRAYMCDKIVAQKNFLFTLDAVIKQAGWRSQEKLNLFYVESQALGREIKVSLEEYIQSMVGILGSQRTKKSFKFSVDFTPLEQALQERCSSDDDEDATATSTATGATASPTDMHEDE
ncbi:hypothetical protein CpB0476 [Chlamydia pneumoniae TW-183]|uniref:Uncharacterized protein n=2 Tax=Chlamydia pneumoniae TaxID=83558 RepID=A0A0F7XQ54_CHLPN|nr:hypothetical protein CpB0476 [Chlamydia pneumoniae TW-183]CRI32966.1 Uncharacterized protein BN1224_Wien1_A_04730 [Chlamydia pneumoniae]CRI36957.1 Uncharacterized protein BN1224_CV14_A_04760 [Chlamydia pneumoniae]CRI38081.1 Uncharacterized protein BN1224_CV15_B_04040 [Chlamydia pneumoniae]CRI39214.1 Uncharacterized protein BN1224_CWL011_A_04780 [Chlamydia pneumoniae]